MPPLSKVTKMEGVSYNLYWEGQSESCPCCGCCVEGESHDATFGTLDEALDVLTDLMLGGAIAHFRFWRIRQHFEEHGYPQRWFDILMLCSVPCSGSEAWAVQSALRSTDSRQGGYEAYPLWWRSGKHRRPEPGSETPAAPAVSSCPTARY